MTEYKGEKQVRFEEYFNMYQEAASETFNGDEYYYKGYRGANALSLYVHDKFSVNAAESGLAHHALRNAL